MPPYQQAMGINSKRCARHQCDHILTSYDLQQACISRKYRIDGVYLIGQHLTQYMDVKCIAFFELVNVRKQLGRGHAAVSG